MRRPRTGEFQDWIYRKCMVMWKACSRLRNFALPAARLSALPAALFMMFAICLIASAPTRAQNANLLNNLPGVENGVPMLVQADEMFYDYENDEITALGSVEIYYNNFALFADKVVYDQGEDRMTAEGNAKLTEPDGNVIFAEFLVVTGDFREGFARSISVLTPDNARVVAASAERVEGNILVFNKAIYTACEIRAEDPDGSPIWQINAVRVVHNQEEQIIEFEDATFEFLGVPIAYFPYFFHPDPSVKRKSGFLVPAIDYSSDLGASFELPYFWAIAPNADLTLTPRVLTEQGFMMQAEFRHRVENGTYTIEGAGLRQANPGQFGATLGNRDWRGMVRTTGEFDLGDQWQFGWDGTAFSEDTFMNVYDLDGRSQVTSQAHLTGLGERNHFDMRVMHFDDLVIVGEGPRLPLVHPVVDYNLVFAQPVMQGQLSMNFNMVSLTRDLGIDQTRLTGEMEWKRTFTDRLGQQFTPFFQARGDAYFVNNVMPGVNNTVTRGMVAAGIEYNYPFISVHDWGQQIIEPVAQIIVRPNEQNVANISNEDAVSLVFDDTTLFDTDKFSGFDRDEGGSRANVGVRYTVQTNNGGHGSLLVGQSFHLGGTNPFGINSGLMRDSSDIIGSLYFEPNSYFGISSQIRVDPSSFQINRHELNTWLRYEGASAAVTYMRVQNQTIAAADPIVNREEVTGNARIPISSEWAALGGYRYDLAGNQNISRSIGLGYYCDCFTASLEFQEVFFRNQDIAPDRRILFRFYFKSLGGSATSTNSLTGQ